MTRSFAVSAGALALGLISAGWMWTRPGAPQDSPDLASIAAQARQQETEASSKIMWIMHELTDVHGPRLTGTPALKGADDWVLETESSWGMANTHLEPYPFVPERLDHAVPGWDNLQLQADAVSPFHGQLETKPLHGTPSTKGVVTAEAVMLEPPPGLARPTGRGVAPQPLPTQAELDAYFAAHRGKIAGKMVLVGEPRVIPVNFNPPPLRRPDQQWDCTFNPTDAGCSARGGRGRGGRGPA
ncbi:MAG: hypothetical protein ACRD1E_01485, partial [Terriglobales bacterium]